MNGTNVNNNDDDESNLDPRVVIKLEELNKWTEKINSLESHFEQANGHFRDILSESTDRLKQLANKLGKSINKSRPYYEARDRLIEIHSRCQRAAINYEKACESYQEAKERIKLAEKKFISFTYHNNNNNYNSNHRHHCNHHPRHPNYHKHNHCNHDYSGEFDPTWQEMLNQANVKLLEAELMKRESEKIHSQSMKDFQAMKMTVLNLERKLARNLQRSKIYFDEKKRFQQQLALIKEDIELTVSQINCSKSRYASTLRELESISEEIHRKRNFRQTRTSIREPGDGAEAKSDKEGQQQQQQQQPQNRSEKYSQTNPMDKNLKLRSKDQLTSRIGLTSQKNQLCSCNIHKEKNSNSFIENNANIVKEKSDLNLLAQISQKWYLHYSDNFGPIYCNLVRK